MVLTSYKNKVPKLSSPIVPQSPLLTSPPPTPTSTVSQSPRRTASKSAPLKVQPPIAFKPRPLVALAYTIPIPTPEAVDDNNSSCQFADIMYSGVQI